MFAPEVAFGRFDDVNGDALYLGKHAISTSDRELVVVNWQAPAAAPYFQASFDDPCGVASRRKFVTDRNTVLDFEEVMFAELARAVIGFPAIVVADPALLLRAIEVYEVDRLDFAEAYLVASAEASGVGVVASFDRSIDRIATVQRLEPV